MDNDFVIGISVSLIFIMGFLLGFGFCIKDLHEEIYKAQVNAIAP